MNYAQEKSANIIHQSFGDKSEDEYIKLIRETIL